MWRKAAHPFQGKLYSGIFLSAPLAIIFHPVLRFPIPCLCCSVIPQILMADSKMILAKRCVFSIF